MTAKPLADPVRRSPLEAVHEARGVRWRTETERWPANFGQPDRERKALAQAAVLVEMGPLDKLLVAGHGTAAVLRAAGLEVAPGHVSPARHPGMPEVWGLAPDEALVLAADDALAARLIGPGAASARYGSAVTLLWLAGPRAPEILQISCPADTRLTSLMDLRLLHGPIANVRVTLARRDLRGTTAYTLAVPRDYAAYLWSALLSIGRDLGLVAAGLDVFEGAGA